ncbi:MAG: hypothetical protein NUK65_11455, partial [Firmicutes bacterium]|nr:hypothetical protein [Bacillota bacterium]
MSFRDEPLAIKVYTIAVFIAAALFFCLHLQIQQILTIDFLFFILLHILLEHLDIPLPRGSGSVAVTFALDLAIIIIFGPVGAVWASFSTLLHIRTFTRFREMWHKMIFNASQIALSTGIAGYAFIASGGIVGHVTMPRDIFPIFISTLVFFLINTTLVMTVISM